MHVGLHPPAGQDGYRAEQRQEQQQRLDRGQDRHGDHDLERQGQRKQQRHHGFLEPLAVRANEREVIQVLGSFHPVHPSQTRRHAHQLLVDGDGHALPHVPQVEGGVAAGGRASRGDQAQPHSGQDHRGDVVAQHTIHQNLEQEREQRAEHRRHDQQGHTHAEPGGVAGRSGRKEKAHAGEGSRSFAASWCAFPRRRRGSISHRRPPPTGTGRPAWQTRRRTAPEHAAVRCGSPPPRAALAPGRRCGPSGEPGPGGG